MPQTLPRADAVGSNFVVNTTVTGVQQEPAVAALSSGNFIVTWMESDGGTGDYSSPRDIRAQIVGRDGAKIGPEILVNTVTAGNQQSPVVAALAGGGFVVTWETVDYPYDVRVQVFGPTGQKIGGEIVEQGGPIGQVWPEVTGLADGGFALTWRGFVDAVGEAPAEWQVKLQLFNADGSARGEASVVNAANNGSSGGGAFYDRPSVASLADGRVVVAWTDRSHSLADSDGSAIFAQVYSQAGVKQGGPLLVNSTITGDQVLPHVVALSGGGFAVTWNDELQHLGKAQLFDSTGAKAGSEISSYYNLTAAALPGNEVLLAWNVSGNTSLQAYDASGNTVGYQSAPFQAEVLGRLAVNSHGQVLMSWNKTFADNANRSDVYAQLAAFGQHGGSGNDEISGTSGPDFIYGEDGNDTLYGAAGNDELNGGAGDDSLRGGSGIDSFDGGSNDTFDNAVSGYGDRVSFEEADATQGAVADLRTGVISNDGFGNSETMAGIESLGGGTAFADTFYGNDQRNMLFGATGDSLYGFGGDDTLRVAGAGVLDGGAGQDRLEVSVAGGFYKPDSNGDGIAETAAPAFYGWVVDLVTGTLRDGYLNTGTITGVEDVVGSDLVDQIRTGVGVGTQYINGGAGNDLIDVGAATGPGAPIVDGGSGEDALSADFSALAAAVTIDLRQALNNGAFGWFANFEAFESVVGTAYGDTFVTSAVQRRDTIDAGGGDDSVTLFLGQDTVNGGTGVDTLILEWGSGLDPVLTTADPTADPAGGFRGAYNDVYNRQVSYTSIEKFVIHTGGGADSIVTGDGDDVIGLGWGNDSVVAGGGNDLIDGGPGADTMRGGLGNDTYEVDNAGDQVIENAGEGTDTIRTTLGTQAAIYTLAANVENLVGTSNSGQTVAGNALDNVLSMGSGNDVLDLSSGGNDTANGGGGNDYVYFGAAFTADDRIVGGAGNDTVGLLGNYNLTLGANTLSGVETFSLLSGTAAGGTEHVTYSITTVDANVPAGGRLTVYAGGLLADESLFFNGYAETDGALSVYGGAGNDTFAGGPANDAFVGGAGNDLMYGLGGADWLEGGLGADGMRGGLGNDVFVYQSAAESTAAATDHIFDFEDISDHISLTNVDADTNVGGDQAFTFIGGNAFSHTAGELRAYQSGSSWYVEGDVNGDGTADLVIQVDTFGGHAMVASDFYL